MNKQQNFVSCYTMRASITDKHLATRRILAIDVYVLPDDEVRR
jgi:hypothetical protein